NKKSSPDFGKVGDALGIHAESVKDRKDQKDALTIFLNSDISYFLYVMVENKVNVFHMVRAGDSISNTHLGTEW
ncbi:acetolactate synthase large subunit, partial [Francisella tularensis subsp. holarctica]|nr:acetolactate synthase large subunit [Francisella tularensis subsp. holarctica]